MVSKFQWKRFWLATQQDPQNDWTATQNCVNYDVFAQAPLDAQAPINCKPWGTPPPSPRRPYREFDHFTLPGDGEFDHEVGFADASLHCDLPAACIGVGRSTISFVPGPVGVFT